MAYENSIIEDYVTEKVLYGYENFAVPIVYGGANYSRFLPPGSYVNAKDLNPYDLALIIYSAVINRTDYEQYFKWTNHYSVEASPKDYHPLCDLCAALHTDFAKNAPAIKNFRKWWMGKDGMKWCLPEHYKDDDWKSSSKVNTKLTVVAKRIYCNLYRKFKPRITDSMKNDAYYFEESSS
ncbi:alpha-(1,3)-fucosyltransferase C-like isoform X2 [Hyposmocoma kahamanoa]|nr:alpha-(1,3)-fucosyltransferase C-like isoform X2 [Hyposmocoma kahamanoa]